MQTSPLTLILNFLKETLNRLFTKSPTFAKVWQIISGIFVAITGIPEIARAVGWEIPDLWSTHVEIAVGWSSRALLFMALLSTQSKTVAISEDGEALKVTDQKKLPFTSSIENKKAESKPLPLLSKIK